MKNRKIYLIGLLFCLAIITGGAFAFNDQNWTNMYLELDTDLTHGNYHEKVDPASSPNNPTISHGWPTGKSKTVYVQWSFIGPNGERWDIGPEVHCKIPPHGIQMVTGHCTPIDINGYWQCQEPQQSPTVNCVS